MTVITTLISKYCTVHATDSLISKIQLDGTVKPKEWKQSKIVPVPELRGAMSYFGLARHKEYAWSTYDWLRTQAINRGSARFPVDFAKKLRDELNNEIAAMKFNNLRDSGIGIHFSAYEYIEEHWIPELFLISNWTDQSYSNVSQAGLCLTRETHFQITKGKIRDEKGDATLRRAVYQYLQGENFIRFNNGDPAMYSPIADTILDLMRTAIKRGKAKDLSDISLWLTLARMPVEVVSRVQSTLYRKDAQIVGGRPHDVAVTPDGHLFSSTGDK